MIKIKRCKCPVLLKKPRKNKVDYNKAKVVETLWKMQHGKCCYCEQFIPVEGHLKAVEHFRPKSIFRNMTNNWDNLLLACAQCNGKKSDHFPLQLTKDKNNPKVIFLKKDSKNRKAIIKNGSYLIINPSNSSINPEDHIDYILDDESDLLGLIINKSNSALGKFTITNIGLVGSYYTKKRKSFFTHLYIAYLNLLEAKDKGDKNLIDIQKGTFRNLLHSSSEHAGFARSFARKKNLDVKFKMVIPN